MSWRQDSGDGGNGGGVARATKKMSLYEALSNNLFDDAKAILKACTSKEEVDSPSEDGVTTLMLVARGGRRGGPEFREMITLIWEKLTLELGCDGVDILKEESYNSSHGTRWIVFNHAAKCGDVDSLKVIVGWYRELALMDILVNKFDVINTCASAKTYCQEVIWGGDFQMQSSWWKRPRRTRSGGCRPTANTTASTDKKRGRGASSTGSGVHKGEKIAKSTMSGLAITRREQLKESIIGVPLVYRLGNPSLKPWSDHEKATLDVAMELQESRPQTSFNTDESMTFFDDCGFRMKRGIIPPFLEEQVFERTIDLILETEVRGSTRSSNVQQFCEPCGVDNRELYLVTTSSCRQIKMQNGSPFMDGDGGSKVAWAVKGQRIKKLGTEDLISPSSLAMTTGSALLPDVNDDLSHPQNLDNPANKPFLDVFDILREHFSGCLSNENEDDVYGYHDGEFPLMCIQLIIGERGKGGGERGPHEDKWATTGAAVIGASVRNPRQIKMKHGSISATYDLPRGSAYILSGVVRYGTIWGLTTPLEHALEPFRPNSSGEIPALGDNISEVSEGQSLQNRQQFERKTRKQSQERVGIRPHVIDPEAVIAKEELSTPYSCSEFDAILELLCSTAFDKSTSQFEKAKSIRSSARQTPNHQYGRLLPKGIQVGPTIASLHLTRVQKIF